MKRCGIFHALLKAYSRRKWKIGAHLFISLALDISCPLIVYFVYFETNFASKL